MATPIPAGSGRAKCDKLENFINDLARECTLAILQFSLAPRMGRSSGRCVEHSAPMTARKT